MATNSQNIKIFVATFGDKLCKSEFIKSQSFQQISEIFRKYYTSEGQTNLCCDQPASINRYCLATLVVHGRNNTYIESDFLRSTCVQLNLSPIRLCKYEICRYWLATNQYKSCAFEAAFGDGVSSNIAN
eukprot:TRINITY_DN8247_c1_g1_i2.p4 TRINITY_DN8247_c1_g1~~TRINITY_DN8247_c1_g1_i2.p4  ORF type:complete len:129 (-),score=0.99 TRINITY_DN8247_c1_g1_i2:907-1293(-)